MSNGAKEPSNRNNRPLQLIIILSTIGLAIAAYLAATYGLNRSPYCAGSEGCDVVRNSQYVTIIRRVLNVPTFGVIGYLAILVPALLSARSRAKHNRYLPLFTYGAALVGFLYSGLYLTGLELFVIHAWCYWCIATALLVSAIFVLSIVDLRCSWSVSWSSTDGKPKERRRW